MITADYSKRDGTIKSFCRMCSHHCAINIVMEQGNIKKVEGNPDHPFTRGHLCVKGRAIQDLVFSPRRLLKPLKRRGRDWQEIDLDTALDEIAGKMLELKKDYGARSIGVWKGEALGGEQQRDLSRRFALAFGTPNMFSNDTLCAASKKAAIRSVLGTFPTPDFLGAECIVIWGSNPLASQFPLYNQMVEAKKRGARIILIDPRRSGFAKLADHYYPIIPATDGALALGIINLLVENRWYDEKFVDKYCLGFKELAEYASAFTPAFVEAETGIAGKDLYHITRMIAESAPRATYRVGVGPEHHDNGYNNIRAIACIEALCGCTDRPGGTLLQEKANLAPLCPDVDQVLEGERPIGAKEFPVFYDNHKEGHTIRAVEAILEGQPYPLKGMILTGANPVLTNPNAGKVRKALESLELFVVRDLFLTETARVADYVLPAASFLERSEIISAGNPQTLSLSRKIMSIPSCQDEYTFWRSLAQRLGFGHAFPWQGEEDLNRWLLKPLGLTLEELKARPQGYQYKPVMYEKYRKQGFATPSGKVEFVSDYLGNYGYERLPVYTRPRFLRELEKGEYSFTLITGARMSRFNHSCYQHIPAFKKAVPRAVLDIHPQDARCLGIHQGDLVEVTSAKGSLRIHASPVGPEDIRQGFLQITHGFEETNVNEITLDDVIDPVSGFPALKSVPVKIRKI